MISTTVRRRPADAVGIDDVAAFAGVSPSTVSNVLNHPERVSPSTQEKVQRAIAVLRYVPNGAARSLAAGGSRTVGLALSDLGNSLFIDIAQRRRGARRRAGRVGDPREQRRSSSNASGERSRCSSSRWFSGRC